MVINGNKGASGVIMYETIGGHDYQDENINIVSVGGLPGGDAFLLVTKQKSALIDSGFPFSAEKMIENVKKVLGARKLDYVILTHSHYDHAGGAAYCRDHWPDVRIISSEYASKIFLKPSAISVMREMSESGAEFFGWGKYEDKLDLLKTDIIVREGDTIDLGNITLQAIEAPGHTKCCIAFYVPEEKMLITCETMGCFASENLILSTYLVGYKISLDFIRRSMKMDVDKLLVPHLGVITGSACKKYFEDAWKSAVMLKDIIINDHLAGKTADEIVEHFIEIFYTPDIKRIWPIKACYLNAGYLVPMVIKEISGE